MTRPRSTNWFAVVTTTTALILFILLGGIAHWLNTQGGAPVAAPGGEIVEGSSGAISIGAGEIEVAAFVDFMCPTCRDFENTEGKRLLEAAANDQITLKIHPVSILDHQAHGTRYSTRAASAAYCVAEEAPNEFLNFFAILFERQPSQGSSGLTDSELTEMAESVDAHGAVDCIANGVYMDYVRSQTKTHKISRTPIIEIGGERVASMPEIRSRLSELLG